MTDRMMRTAFLLLSFLWALSAPAMAAPAINDAGEQALLTHIQDILSRQKNARAFSGGGMTTEGDILIEQADSYYAVTLPNITVSNAQGGTTAIGIIAINATPGDTPGNWKLSLSLPTPITWADAAGKPQGKLDLGTQRLSGIWNEGLAGFITLDAGYDGIKIEDFATRTTQTIAKTTITSQLKETAPQIWAGDATITLSGLSSASTAHTGNASADNVTLKFNVAGLSAAKQKEMREKLGAFKENTDPKDLQNMSPAGQLALYNMFIDVMRSAGDNVGGTLAINNGRMTMPAIAQQTARTVALKTGSFGFQMNGMDKGTVTLALRPLFTGLVSTPENPEALGLTPTDLNLDIKIENLPFEELVKVGQDSLKAAGRGGAAKQFAGIQAMMVLPQILSKAGAQVTITDSTIKGPAYDAKANGTMNADSTSTLGAVGKVKTEISGLDGIIKTLQGRLQTASAAAKVRLQKALQMLTVINLAGQIEKRGDKTVKIYDLELTKEGQVMLNGSDLNLLTGGGTPAADNAPAPAPTVDKPAAR